MNQSETETSLLAVYTDATVPLTIPLQASHQYLAQAHTAEARIVSSINPYGIPAQREDAQTDYMRALWPSLSEIAEKGIFDQPRKAMPRPVPLDLLLKAGGVIYGSRGLHVEDQYSDYDFAFSYEEHKSLFRILMNSDITTSIPTEYFSSVPEAGYHTFLQYEGLDSVSNKKVKVDVIFVHNDEDLDVIRASVQDLQSIPQYMLRDKKFRINAYNKALQHRGWKVAPDLRNSRRDPRPTVIRRERDRGSRGGSITGGFAQWF